jgi:hypothetical protein
MLGHDLEAAREHRLFLRGLHVAHPLVDVAVAADLVAGGDDRLHGVGMVLHDPGRNEERGPDLHLAQQVEDARKRFADAEGTL